MPPIAATSSKIAVTPSPKSNPGASPRIRGIFARCATYRCTVGPAVQRTDALLEFLNAPDARRHDEPAADEPGAAGAVAVIRSAAWGAKGTPDGAVFWVVRRSPDFLLKCINACVSKVGCCWARIKGVNYGLLNQD